MASDRNWMRMWALGRAQRAAQADLGAAFQHGDDHDVGDADGPDEQGHRAEAEEQAVERALGVGLFGQLGRLAEQGGAVADGEHVRAQAVDLGQQARLGGGGQAEDRHDGRNADGDAQRAHYLHLLLIDSGLTLATSERGLDRRELFDLATVTRRALALHDTAAERRGLHLDLRFGHAAVLGDPDLTERMAANLIDNAIRYNLRGGSLEVRTETRYDHAVLTVSNTSRPRR
jgi:signal transduction histidine kinase